MLKEVGRKQILKKGDENIVNGNTTISFVGKR